MNAATPFAHFEYRDGALHAEDVPLSRIAKIAASTKNVEILPGGVVVARARVQQIEKRA